MAHVNRLIHHPAGDPTEPLKSIPKATRRRVDPDGRHVFLAERPVEVGELIEVATGKDAGTRRVVQNYASLNPDNLTLIVAR